MRKRFPTIVRVLLALALVASLVAVTAVPVSAQTAVTAVGFTASPATAGAGAQYVVGFTTSAAGALTWSVSTITVTFPAGVTLPATMPKAYVSVGTTVTTVDPVVNQTLKTITLITPVAVVNSAAATVTFAQVAGIENPDFAAVANTYVGYVNTSSDVIPVASATYSAITTDVNFTPSMGPAGTAINVTGVGFAPSKSIDIFDAGSVVIGTGTTTATGTFDLTAYAATTSTGTLTATDGDGNTHTTTATFTVTPTPTPTPVSVTLGATSGYPGQGITANGADWVPGAVIVVTLAGNPVTTSPSVIHVGLGAEPYPWAPGIWLAVLQVPEVPFGVYTGINGLRFTDGVNVVYYNFTVAPAPGTSENQVLMQEWSYGLAPRYPALWFGSSAAIADLGPDVNINSGEPDEDLEVVVGSDGYWFYSPELGYEVPGLWRTFDSQGNIEWVQSTESDEARSSPALADLDGDGELEVIAGTTSGWCVEVMYDSGGFVWTFPYPPQTGGPFTWPSSPAIADIDPFIDGLEVIIGNWYLGSVWAFDGDNTDGENDGISADTSWYPYPPGNEGTDWDVLWTFQTGGGVISTPAVGDIDSDGWDEVVFGSTDGKVYSLRGISGTPHWSYQTGGAIYGSAGLADFDGDDDLEIVIGSTDHRVYFFDGDENSNGIIDSAEVTSFLTGGPVYSSPAIGDVDGDGSLEVVVGSNNGQVYSLSYDPKNNSVHQEWATTTGGSVYSSAALAYGSLELKGQKGKHDRPWPMFRNSLTRTGYYADASKAGLDIYIGSDDGFLYLIYGKDGHVIDKFMTNGPIRTSPSVADIDGDRRLEVLLYDWSSYDTFWCVEDSGVRYELFVEIDYMTGRKPHESVLTYIENYFAERGIRLTFDVDDEVPFDYSYFFVPEEEFFEYEATYNDGNDKIVDGNMVITSKEKWVLFGTYLRRGSPGLFDIMVGGYTYSNTQAGNYIFIADLGNDMNWLLDMEGAETVTLMHELGHAIGILKVDKSNKEVYDRVKWSVMAKINSKNVNSKNPRYSPAYWNLRDLDYYRI